MVSVGQKLGRYQICSVIGAGGMGEVFLADDLQLSRKVALKVLPDNIAADKDRLRRFEQEAKAASALNHPNILTVFEFGSENGIQFLATEYVKGETLRDKLQRDYLSFSSALDITIQIASALQAAHSAHIIHRDIKPENVMIREDGYVKVLDFGLAKLIDNLPYNEEAQTFMQVRTLAGMILGTPGYMSPEQALGKHIDGRTDFFSLGVVLFEMLTGTQPFAGETINHTIVAILEKDPPPLSHFVEDFPGEIERIVRKCLAKNANDRYQNARELIDDLRLIKTEVDYQQKTIRKTPNNNQTETKTDVFDIHTDKTIHIETDPANQASTFKPRFFKFTNDGKRAFQFRNLVTVILTVMAIGILAYFLLPPIWQLAPHPEAMKLFESGTESLREGTYYKASKLFEDAIKIDNEFSGARAGLAAAWTELDYANRAQREMLKVNEIQNKNQTLLSAFYKTEDALRIEAINAIVTRNFPQAIEIYQRIAAKNPAEDYVYLDLGRAFEKNEDIDRAIDCYEKAVNLNSQYGAGFLRLGILFGRKMQYNKSAEAFDKAENIYDRSSNDEGVAEVKYQRGVFLNYREKLADARNQFEQVINNPRANKHQQIRALMQISSVCSSAGDAACAEEYASKAITLAKQERMENLASNGLINLGNAFLARGEYDKAEQNFQTAVEFSRKDDGLHNEARALLALASLRIQQKKPDEAEAFVRQALPFFEKGGYQKEVAQANLILGRANETKENYDAALQAFSVVAASQAASEADRAYAEMVTGIILMNKEKFPEALNHYEKSLHLYESLNNPYYAAYSLFYLIEAFNQLGYYEKAAARLSQAQEIIQKNPNYQTQLSPRIHLLKAQIALGQRNFPSAITEAVQSLKTADPSVKFEANRTLALAQAHTNSFGAEAENNCRKALQYAAETKNLKAINSTKLTLAEIYLLSNRPAESLEIVEQAKNYFVDSQQLESSWRAMLVAAQASRRKGQTEKAEIFTSEAAKIFDKMQNEWGRDHFDSYRAKPDVNFYLQASEKAFNS